MRREKRWSAWLGITVLVMGVSAGLSGTALPDESAGNFIVVLEESVSNESISSVAQELGRRHGLALGHTYQHVLNGFSAQIPASRLNALRSDPRVNNIVEDQVLTAFCHLNSSQTLTTGVDRVDADLSLTANINGGANGLAGLPNLVNADIAILDTGIYPHADLNLYRAVDCTKKGGCQSVAPKDPNGHGTHVAGIAAAVDNNSYVVGIAPGARLWSVRVLNNQGMGFTSWTIAGIDYATANAAAIEVANMSLGGSGSNSPNCGVSSAGKVVDPFHKAICNSVNKGVVYTVAAGNESQDAANTTPAAYPEVITVSALADSDGKAGGLGPATSYGSDDTFATFSNFGLSVAMAAPGVDILSTFPGDRQRPGGSCATMSGTSMAAPHVAGGVALYLATHLKPVNAAGTVGVRDALRAAGECPPGATKDSSNNCSAVWPGDPDGIGEPLLYGAGF